MEVCTLGIDLAKKVFRLHGVDAKGRTVLARQLRRPQRLPFLAQLRPCLIGLEACGGAHYFAREMARRGHEVKMMSPRFVRPYVKSNKNDARDAEAICRGQEQSSTRHSRAASGPCTLLIRERTALMNQMRGLLAEYGIVTAQGAAALRGSKEGTLRRRCHRRPVQYLNNLLEQDHRAIKRRVKAKQGFREFRAACRTIAGYEAMHMIRKGQARLDQRC